MKIDRFVKALLVLIALLLAFNCAKNQNGSLVSGTLEGSVEAAPQTSFLIVGKSYEAVGSTYQPVFKVLEVQNSGWAKVELTRSPEDKGKTVWFNPSAYVYIIPLD